MLEPLVIGKANVRQGQPVPPFLDSLVAAASRGESLVPYIQSIVSSFGFDSFEYGVSTMPHADKDSLAYIYSTIPDWSIRYDKMGYIEADPRMFLTCTSAVPLIWDQSNIRRFGPQVTRFLDDALAHGLASGVSFMWHGPYGTGMAVGLNSRIPFNDEIRVKSITRNLPDIVMFGHYFHEVFVLPALSVGKEPPTPFKRLSRRERQCLDLAARGMTTRDISTKLDITSRTVQFHFTRIYDKLGAANRHEAIARAVQTGIVRGR